MTWTVTKTEDTTIGSHAAIREELVGHVDNGLCPAISVDIQMILVTPASATGPVPVMMMFGRGELPQPAGSDTPATEQLIADGWGYAFINPASIQADNGAGLTKGIIGLVNKGQPRKPDDWGALRAWAWGASRGLDYLETDKAVDAKHVGIEGVSRYGKAALVTMAFDTRFAVVLVGSSGEGGAKLHRRNLGEAVENLTGSGEYHWMAGNFLKYGAAEATFGSKNAGDLPVDAHELIALCAPRLTFISYGVPEKGDANWLDQQGSFMATVAAGPVFRLLGAKDLGEGDYRTRRCRRSTPGLLDGQLAWRQHDGGHTDGPNWKYFIAVGRQVPGPHTVAASGRCMPAARTDQNSLTAHAQLLEKAKHGPHRRLLRRRLHHAALGRDRLSGPAGQLEPELLRLECGRFRMGRGQNAEHPLAPRQWRTGRSESEGDRAAGRHEQRRRRGDSGGERRRHGGGHHAWIAGHPAADRGQGARSDDRRHRHLAPQRQHLGDARHRQDQRQSLQPRRRQEDPMPEYQR